MDNEFKENFDYGSVLPTVVFIVGLLAIYFFLTEQYSEGFMAMLSAFIVYVIDNLVSKSDSRPQTQFNFFLDNMATFVAFALSSFSFAFIFFKEENSFLVLLIIYFFAVTTILSSARNWALDYKNSKGWPIQFNGIFLPLLYWIFKFYLQSPGKSIFLLYFVIVGFLCTTNYNFLNLGESNKLRSSAKSSRFDDDEEFENYISIKERPDSGIKKAATFYKTKDVLPLVGKAKSKDEEVPEHDFTVVKVEKQVKPIEDKAPEIPPEDDMILDDDWEITDTTKRKKDDDWEIDENDPQLKEFENEEQVANQPVINLPPKEQKFDEDGKLILEPAEKQKRKGFFKSLFSFGDAKDDPDIVEDPSSRPSKEELEKDMKKQEKERAKEEKKRLKEEEKREKEAKKRAKEEEKMRKKQEKEAAKNQ